MFYDDFVFIDIDLKDWTQKRDDLVERSNQDLFSNDITITDKARAAEKKLAKLRADLVQEDETIITGSYYEKLPKLLNSEVYKCLNVMPKPVVHHIHLTAACPISFLVERLCYYDFVYYNQKEQLFKTSKNGCDLPGYVKVNDLRKYWSRSADFDKYLYDEILLREGTDTQEHHEIWKYF